VAISQRERPGQVVSSAQGDGLVALGYAGTKRHNGIGQRVLVDVVQQHAPRALGVEERAQPVSVQRAQLARQCRVYEEVPIEELFGSRPRGRRAKHCSSHCGAR
jgi:hypothetical protein